MNIKLLAQVAARYPFLARIAELAIISGSVYLVGIIISNDPLNRQALFAAVFTPVIAGLSKLKRDLEKKHSGE